MQTYITPSIQDHDFSKFQFAKNQGTCPTNLELEQFDNFFQSCGGDIGIPNMVGLCLSQNVDENLLVGLILDMEFGSNVTILSCSPQGAQVGCPARFECSVSEDVGNSNCLNRILCPDGTEIDSCPNPNACFFGDPV